MEFNVVYTNFDGDKMSNYISDMNKTIVNSDRENFIYSVGCSNQI